MMVMRLWDTALLYLQLQLWTHSASFSACMVLVVDITKACRRHVRVAVGCPHKPLLGDVTHIFDVLSGTQADKCTSGFD